MQFQRKPKQRYRLAPAQFQFQLADRLTSIAGDDLNFVEHRFDDCPHCVTRFCAQAAEPLSKQSHESLRRKCKFRFVRGASIIISVTLGDFAYLSGSQ